jgi:hypothetical protein
MGKGAKVSPGEMPDAEGRQANCVERGFESLGAALGDGGCRSWIATIVTLVVMMGACSGFSVLETENRPEKQWVPDGAIALEHSDYVKTNWPGSTRFNVRVQSAPLSRASPPASVLCCSQPAQPARAASRRPVSVRLTQLGAG